MEKEIEKEVNCSLQKDGSVTRANSLTHHSKASNVKQMMMSPIQQCSIMQHLIHNVVDMEGRIAMQITPEARGALSSTDQFATCLTHNGGRRLSSGKVLTIEMIGMLGKLFLIQIKKARNKF